ncbi:DUF4157 domain-containing protein [Aquimarina sp. RZ0]|uniref:eCIS core domain-containing protein n=1 Tax=Aquimarina sp. RZ0 TaxID=2607730 RepID=UPI001CB6CEA6|nr:DUF4157 domain-containing protein [Aquimarina sp. RZ0]
MKPQTDKTQEPQKEIVQRVQQEHSSGGEATITDNRPAIAVQRKLRSGIDSSDNTKTPIQRKANKTGLPDNLKSGIENLSGYSMDDVKVHYNSSKPAQLQAHAYAQGTDIHLAPGQQKHLPHEAWHVVQQKQGRVKPTRQLKSKVNINDDAGLEKEADVMGGRAMNGVEMLQRKELLNRKVNGQEIAQREPDPEEEAKKKEEAKKEKEKNAAILIQKYIKGRVVKKYATKDDLRREAVSKELEDKFGKGWENINFTTNSEVDIIDFFSDFHNIYDDMVSRLPRYKDLDRKAKENLEKIVSKYEGYENLDSMGKEKLKKGKHLLENHKKVDEVIHSGKKAPKKISVPEGTLYYKLVTESDKEEFDFKNNPSAYYMTQKQFNELRTEDVNVEEKMGLPGPSVAKKYFVFRIKSLTRYNTVYESEVAEAVTSHKLDKTVNFTAEGGGKQIIILDNWDRKKWEKSAKPIAKFYKE